MTAFEFVEVNPGTIQLGWQYDELLPAEAIAAMSDICPADEYLTKLFSSSRTVTLAPFMIATRGVLWRYLCTSEELFSCTNFGAACRLIEAELAKSGWRLPTEDEFEAAAGGELFAWGNEFPPGTPYPKLTTFTKHLEPNSNGLFLNANSHDVEIVSTVFKMGDGGVTVRWHKPSPLAWLTLAPSFRLPAEMVEGCWREYLQSAWVRPVLL